MKLNNLWIAGSFAALVACGGGGATTGGANVPKKPDGPVSSNGTPVSQETVNRFQVAIDAFAVHEKAADWNDAICKDVADKFNAGSEGGKIPEALFDAGLAWQRCGNDKEAKSHFEKALGADAKFHPARVQIALYQYKADQNENAVIDTLRKTVLDAKFQNVPALVALAAFEMQRDADQEDKEFNCKSDEECAKLNLQRALAIDDGFMPASNQLALYYFQRAKKNAGATKSKGGRGRSIATNAALGKRADVQQLELAGLVASQAIRKNPSYAPIHNTAGLIQNELGLVNGAVAEFKQAATLDPRLFEAQMNYAAVNLSFRGFDQAQGAYERALKMRSGDYDAHLGLALALRGQITDVNYETQVAAVQAELDAAKKIDANRPDAFYNEGILTQEYKAKSGGDKNATVAKLKEAKAIFETFIQKAAGKTEYDGAVKRSKERMEDIDGTIAFLLASNEPLPARMPNLDEIAPGLFAVANSQPMPLAAR